MSAYQAGRPPAVSLRAVLARASAVVVLSALAGCASTPRQYTANDVRVAQAAVIDVEDDGLPAQTPPPARVRHLPDDPSEPFSRNYGGENPSRTTTVAPEEPKAPRLPQPLIPGDLPPAFRKQLAAAVVYDE